MARRSTWLLGLLAWSWGASALAQGRVPEPPPPVSPWYDALDFNAFVDAYGQVDWGFPKPQTGESAPTRVHDGQMGFAVAWVGLDLGYAPEPVGGTVSLRFGPAAESYGTGEPTSLQYVKQAFASFRPGGPEGRLTLDLGKFDTPFGAEVGDSHHNMTYTRGVLWNAQPRFHTGLRARAELWPELSLLAVIVNGVNRSVDNNVGKTFGLKAELSPWDWLDVGLGWLGGPEQDDFATVSCPADSAYQPSAQGCGPSAGAPAQDYTVDRGNANDFEAWTHLLDVVLAVTPLPPLQFLANASYGTTGVRSQNAAFETDVTNEKWYGASLTGRYALSEVWALAARGEYLVDDAGLATGIVLPSGEPLRDATLATATLTIEARPTQNLILRLENRADFVLEGSPTADVFTKAERDRTDRIITTTLGAVLTTN